MSRGPWESGTWAINRNTFPQGGASTTSTATCNGAIIISIPPRRKFAHPTDPWILWCKFLGGADTARYMIDVSNSPLYRNEQVAGFQGYLTDVLNREAVQFIERNKDRPFFLYLAHAGQHVPVQATEKYLSRFPTLSDEKQRPHLRGGPQRDRRRRRARSSPSCGKTAWRRTR